MYKQIISSILVFSLLNLIGCYSSKVITAQELSQVENLDDVEIFTTDSIHYSFERYTDTERMLNAPDKFYYEDWLATSDSLKVLGLSFDAISFKPNFKLKKDKLALPFEEMNEISMSEFDEVNTIVAFGVPVALYVALIIALHSVEWKQ